MNHHNINAIVYYLIVFIRYVLPITLVFIGIGRWSYAKSINNPEKQIMGVNPYFHYLWTCNNIKGRNT